MKIQELYKKIKTIKITHDVITWILLISIMVFVNMRVSNLKTEIDGLNNNQTLVLYQLQDNENTIKRVNNDVVKVAKNIANVDFLLNKYAKEFGIDPALLHAVATVESGKNPRAVSKSGALGVVQIMPSTAKAMGENPYTTEGNIRAGAKYLAYLRNKYKGNEELMLSAYNAGEGNVARNGNKPPTYTHKYIQKVKNEKRKYNGTSRTANKENVVIIHSGVK